eukprot:292481_1
MNMMSNNVNNAGYQQSAFPAAITGLSGVSATSTATPTATPSVQLTSMSSIWNPITPSSFNDSSIDTKPTISNLTGNTMNGASAANINAFGAATNLVNNNDPSFILPPFNPNTLNTANFDLSDKNNINNKFNILTTTYINNSSMSIGSTTDSNDSNPIAVMNKQVVSQQIVENTTNNGNDLKIRYDCKDCGKRFKHKSNLKIHQIIHTP